jgi:hypothetical protein
LDASDVHKGVADRRKSTLTRSSVAWHLLACGKRRIPCIQRAFLQGQKLPCSFVWRISILHGLHGPAETMNRIGLILLVLCLVLLSASPVYSGQAESCGRADDWRDFGVLPRNGSLENGLVLFLDGHPETPRPGEEVEVRIRVGEECHLTVFRQLPSGEISLLWQGKTDAAGGRSLSIRASGNQGVDRIMVFAITDPGGLEAQLLAPVGGAAPPSFADDASRLALQFGSLTRSLQRGVRWQSAQLNLCARPGHDHHEEEARARTFDPRRLYALAIGCCPPWSHKEADSCGEDVGLFLSSWLPSTGMPEDHVRTLLQAQATYEGVQRGFEWLGQVTGPEDVVVLYLNAHGVRMRDPHDPEARRQSEVFVLWSEEFPFAALYAVASRLWMTSSDLVSLIEATPARRRILIVDSCHCADTEEALAPENAPVDYGTRDAALLAAAGANQFALERKTGPGYALFTYHLAQAIQHGATDLLAAFEMARGQTLSESRALCRMRSEAGKKPLCVEQRPVLTDRLGLGEWVRFRGAGTPVPQSGLRGRGLENVVRGPQGQGLDRQRR